MPLSWKRSGKNFTKQLNKILQYAKQHGESLNTEITAATKIPLINAHLQLSALAAKHEVILCNSTKYVKSKIIKATICRISGYIRPAKAGAKPKV